MSTLTIPVIAITGGTTAGKTSVMVNLDQELPKYGVKPYFVREAATDLFSGGIKHGEIQNTQELIMRRMLSDEEIFKDAARGYPGNLRPVIICDRGIIDCMVYSKPGEFLANAQKLGTTLHHLRERYDAVIHLVTTANGAPDVFRSVFKNNPFRVEGKDENGEQSIERALVEAVEKDHLTQNAWLGSQKLKVIPNRATFEEKKRDTLKAILGVLGIPLPQEIEFKYLVPRFFSRDDLPMSHETVLLTQYYLSQTPQLKIMSYPKEATKIVERIRIREYEGSRTFIYTLKAFIPGDPNPYEPEDFMSEREFVQLVSYANSPPIKKDRTYFVHQHQYFEFDQFKKQIDNEANNILELEVSEKSDRPMLPEFIPNLIDVTSDDFYRNENIAKRLVAV